MWLVTVAILSCSFCHKYQHPRRWTYTIVSYSRAATNQSQKAHWLNYGDSKWVHQVCGLAGQHLPFFASPIRLQRFHCELKISPSKPDSPVSTNWYLISLWLVENIWLTHRSWPGSLTIDQCVTEEVSFSQANKVYCKFILKRFIWVFKSGATRC